MYIERLTHLRDILLVHHDNGIRFNLNYWHMSGCDSTRDDGWCGTEACAIGLACLDPVFNEQGFGFQLSDSGQKRPFYSPNGFTHWSAVEKFFGLSIVQAEHLFSADSYPHYKTKGDIGAKAVAQRIDKFIAGHGEIEE